MFLRSLFMMRLALPRAFAIEIQQGQDALTPFPGA